MIWIAYYTDWSEFAVFGPDEELECLRYALANSMQAARVKSGRGVREQVS